MASSFKHTDKISNNEASYPGDSVSPQEDTLVYIGTLTKPHGIRGAIRLFPEFSPLENFAGLKSKELYLKFPKTPAHKKAGTWRKAHTESHAYSKGFVLLKIKEVTSVETAELIRGAEVYVNETALWDLPEGKYYGFQLQGLSAVNAETSALLGIVTALETGHSYDYIEIKKPDGKTFLVPYLPQFIENVNLPDQIIRVRIIEGLDDL